MSNSTFTKALKGLQSTVWLLPRRGGSAAGFIELMDTKQGQTVLMIVTGSYFSLCVLGVEYWMALKSVFHC